MPDIPERAALECIVNSLIHRDYLELGSEVHIDIFDNRLEIYSPGGMFDGSLVQNLDTDHIPSKRRNPVIADIFSRMNYMERRGSGFRKIKNDYHMAVNYRPEIEPEFYSDATSFWVTLYNLNYQVPIEKTDVLKEKQVFEEEKTGVSEKKQSFEQLIEQLNFSKPTENKIRTLHDRIGNDVFFGRTDVMRITGLTSSPAGELLKKMKSKQLIVDVKGQGKGKYKFKA